MLINRATLPEDMKNALDEYEAELNQWGSHLFGFQEFLPGTYYLCTGCGEIRELPPPCPHRPVVVENCGWYSDYPSEVFDEILLRSQRSSIPREVLYIPGRMGRPLLCPLGYDCG